MAMLKDSKNQAALRSLHEELWERLQHCEEQEAEAILRNSLGDAAGAISDEVREQTDRTASGETAIEAGGGTTAGASEPLLQPFRPFSAPQHGLLTLRGAVFSAMAGVSLAALLVVLLVYAALWIE
ncbi:hypothetical protein PAESOLCIP111_04727 [Paenibacillus solanacearum]|uniref:Uncharacterized protein n=1 Tax=Paenibacillus solanacearum TaxID=2048548 RepID=A0A916K4T6_9BACL|nr:hypothetical protein [Paenibacillus solanacearum]CAG7644515.1 hypothetical protein PAESOLCIP111_04727 [Paenibacillus solanacearum]